MKRIISLLCAAAVVLSISGCGMKKKPEEVVTEFCDAMTAFDFAAMTACVDGDSDEADGFTSDISNDTAYDVLKRNAESIVYTVGESSVKDHIATVPVKFTHPDVSDEISEAIGETIARAFVLALSGADSDMADELFEDVFLDKISELPEDTARTEIVFQCVLTEDGWKLKEVNEEVLNILTSNAVKALEELDRELEKIPELYETNPVRHETPLGQDGEFGPFRLKVTECLETNVIKGNWDDTVAEKGTKYVIFTVEAENISKQTAVLSIYNFHVCDSQDRTYEQDISATIAYRESFFTGQLAPNIPETFTAVYKVPEDCDGYYLSISNPVTGELYCFYGT